MIVWVLLSISIVAVLVISKLCYRLAFYSPNRKEQDVYAIPPGEQYEKVADTMLKNIYEVAQIPYEQIYTFAFDGIILAAKYYHFRDNAPLQIQFHGYRGNGTREFASVFNLAKQLGMNVLLVDQRAHGKSGGHTISFGIRERYDCKAWVDYACRRFGVSIKIILSGVSMGAATVLMASDLNLPVNVVGITADCPYSSPGAIIRKVCKDIKLPPRLAYLFGGIGAFLFGGFRIWESSAVKSVRRARIPILLIHGEDDRFVPCHMSYEIYKSCRGKRMCVTFPEAGHGLSYLTDPEKYQSIFREYLIICGLDV